MPQGPRPRICPTTPFLPTAQGGPCGAAVLRERPAAMTQPDLAGSIHCAHLGKVSSPCRAPLSSRRYQATERLCPRFPPGEATTVSQGFRVP